MPKKIWIGGSTSGKNSANVAGNWSPSGVPTGSDDIYFTHRSTSSLLHDLTTLSTVNGELHVESGYLKKIGSSTGPNYFELKPSAVWFNGVREAFINVKASTGVVHVTNTGGGSFKAAGLNLLGTAIGRIDMQNGVVAVAINPGETSTVAEIEMTRAGRLLLGKGVTWTDASIYGGSVSATSGTTNSVVNIFGGVFSAAEDCKLKDLNTHNGKVFYGGTQNIKNVTMRGGNVDSLLSGQNRTVTNLKIYHGQFSYDPNVLTVTNYLHPDTPVTIGVMKK
jgi:hypothetical protein